MTSTWRLGAVVISATALVLTTGCATNEGATSSDQASQSATGLSGTLQGTGASSMKSAQEVWRAAFQTAHAGVTVNYAPDGSGAGRTAFAAGSANFAGSDRALKDSEMTGEFKLCAADTKPINLPVYISPIAIAYNLEGVKDLALDGTTIAKIFRGEITKWNDPAIAKLNPSAKLPDTAITAVHRSDNSGTTENFTSTLAKVAPDAWTDKPSGDWPASLSGEGAQGTTGVVSAVKNGQGTIGYADLSGLEDGMTTVKYIAADGQQVDPTAEAAAAIVAASKKHEGRSEHDWALDLDRTAAGYPFILVSYAIACQQYQDAHIGTLVHDYLSYIVSDEGQKAAVPQAGNAPLAGELATKIRAAADSIK